MDGIKAALAWSIKNMTPEALLNWDLDEFISPLIDTKAPTLGSILQVAAQMKRAKETNKIKSYTTACNVIIIQLAKERSHHALYFATPFTLFLWTNGASWQTIKALHKCGLCMSFSSLSTLLHQLADQSLKHAAHITSGPHALCWDNINIKTSIFVEQRDDAPAKDQSRTFAVIYQIDCDPQDMQWAVDLTFNGDIRPSSKQCQSFRSQLHVHIINILLRCCKSFEGFEHPDDLRFMHVTRRKMPDKHHTKQFPLQASTIDESSISGNIAVIDDVYTNQLKISPEKLVDRVVPSFNDQLTNTHVRRAKALRLKDVNPFTQLQFLQLGFRLFHLCMNLIWALLHVHHGSIQQIRSLSYFFSLLDCVRLSGEHPDYHTLMSTLLQILHGIILNAWKAECHCLSLTDFASSKPSADELLEITKNKAKEISQLSRSHLGDDMIEDDVAYRNICLLTRDLLYVLELTEAIPSGDFGCVEDILGSLAMIFCGVGSNNYSTEILHWIYNIKNIWTPKFVEIMQDGMLVNMTGLEGHWMPVDLNIEHLIKFLKLFYAVKGIHSSWDRLGDISPSVDLLQNVRKQVLCVLKTSYHGSTHSDLDMSSAIRKVAYKVGELELDQFVSNRSENGAIKPVVDTLMAGAQKLKSSTLTTFNLKVKGMMAGKEFADEDDEIPDVNFELTLDPDSY